MDLQRSVSQGLVKHVVSIKQQHHFGQYCIRFSAKIEEEHAVAALGLMDTSADS